MAISLTLIIGIFCAIMFGVLAYCLRARKRSLADKATGTHRIENDRAEDKRITLLLFGSIIVGALLALITMYLVFFRQWD